MFIRHRDFFQRFRTAFTTRLDIVDIIHHTAFISCNGQNGWGDGCHLQAIAMGSHRRVYRFKEITDSDMLSYHGDEVN